MSELATIDITRIDIVDGHNPRGTIDADQLQPLADSIGTHGVLQPIIVQAAGDRYTLVAGERRYRAAGIAGLTEIPAVVRDLNGDAFSVVIVENLQREQLTPIEEARAFQRACNTGMAPAELAAAINVSEQLVRDRLALLKLPETVQAKVDARELTLAAAKSLQTFAVAGDLVVAKAAELLTKEYDPYEDAVTARDLEWDPAWVLDSVLEELSAEGVAEGVPFLAAATTGDGRGRAHAFLNQELAWPEDVDVAALQKKVKLLPDVEYGPRYCRPRAEAQELDDADLDAARAFGCVLTLPAADDSQGVWITDAVWLADRLSQKLDQALERRAKKAGAKKTPANATEAEKQRLDSERKERQKEQAAQLSARERNLRIGIELFKKLHAPAPSADGMRAIAELVLAYAGEDLGRRGLRFTDEESQTVTTRKDGTISRVAYLKQTTDCRALLAKRLGKAETAEEIYGVLLQAIVAAGYADVNAAPSSARWGEVRAMHSYSASKPLLAAVDAIAKSALPDDLRKKSRKKSRPRR